VRQASPVVELDTYAAAPPTAAACRCVCWASMRCSVATLAPELLPRPAPGSDRFVMLDPRRRVRQRQRARSGWPWSTAMPCVLQSGPGGRPSPGRHVAGRRPPLLVMDVAAAQAASGWPAG
jgi:hypothetical protein